MNLGLRIDKEIERDLGFLKGDDEEYQTLYGNHILIGQSNKYDVKHAN